MSQRATLSIAGMRLMESLEGWTVGKGHISQNMNTDNRVGNKTNDDKCEQDDRQRGKFWSSGTKRSGGGRERI